MTNSSALRSARIDFLRGVSIFAVLALHFSLSYGLVKSPLAQIIPANWIRAAVTNGNYGVTLFFVISGFLITSNNLLRYGNLGQVSLRQFYAFRFSRIIPPILLALCIIVPLGLLDVPSFMNSRHGQPCPPAFFAIAVLSVLTFWHNVLMQAVGYFNYCLNIYWSLSVEEVFYLTFPLACVMLKRDRYIIALCIAAIVVGPIYRSFHTDNEIYFMYAYPACFDAIAFGCLSALLQRKVALGPHLGALIRYASGVGLAVCYFAGIDGHEIFGFSLIALCAVGLLTNAFEPSAQISRFNPGRIVAWFGKHSYELYLFHIILLAGLRDLVPKATLPYTLKLPLFVAFLSLSGLLAGVVARYFADPLNARLRRCLASDPQTMP
ncbi:MAG TPA: acyltransferase [Steroidobacteraceae bacterium]|jgi:peptidoglycan/LPS O-acetylase OafA/YrhL|nr:acyltransferase [Steroidobacteraceae bacterium]